MKLLGTGSIENKFMYLKTDSCRNYFQQISQATRITTEITSLSLATDIFRNFEVLIIGQPRPLQLPASGAYSFGSLCHACLTRVHAKLFINQPDDPYEQGTDRVTEQVMDTAESHMQRICPSGEDESLQMKPFADPITPLIHRQRSGNKGTHIQRIRSN
jgi:hypothetical protein